MNVEFYFDPSCPYCWITSRWLVTVQNNKPEITVTWRQFSLAIKNDELSSENGPHMPAHRVQRIILAAAMQGADLGELYSAFGSRNHVMGDDFSDQVIAEVLADLKLPAELLAFADDTSLDAELETSMNSALEVVGNDVGVPIIIFNTDGERMGYFGPVLNAMPTVSDSLKLWDSLAMLATNKDFYELKRERTTRPDTASTAICRP